jgi:hypothetical protein
MDTYQKETKQKEKVLEFIGFSKIKAHIWEYDYRCDRNDDFVKTIWVDNNELLYYKIGDKYPYTYKLISNEDGDIYDVVYVKYKKYDDIIYRNNNELLLLIINKLINKGFTITINKTQVTIDDGTDRYKSEYSTEYINNILNIVSVMSNIIK